MKLLRRFAPLGLAAVLLVACSSGSTPKRSVTPPTATPPTVATNSPTGVAESGFVAFGDFGGVGRNPRSRSR